MPHLTDRDRNQRIADLLTFKGYQDLLEDLSLEVAALTDALEDETDPEQILRRQIEWRATRRLARALKDHPEACADAIRLLTEEERQGTSEELVDPLAPRPVQFSYTDGPQASR